MSAHVLIILWKELGKDNMRGFVEHLIDFPQKSLINSMIQEHEYKIIFIIWH